MECQAKRVLKHQHGCSAEDRKGKHEAGQRPNRDLSLPEDIKKIVNVVNCREKSGPNLLLGGTL